MAREWWQDAVFYQIYPRSFADTNGDGIGDLDGITAHLDYLNDGLTDRSGASLGIDAIWLSPINPSPLKDWGYDVSDYCDVHPDLGTLASFDRLIAEAHRRNIRIVLDLVPNHTSNQHLWFLESRSSRTNPKRDWYLWRRGRNGGPPNNWKSTFGGSAWEFDAASGEWYLHSFLREQPDLNFRNPEVVEAMHNVIRFWLDRGVDGFRVDVIAQMIKDAQFRDNPEVPNDRQLTQLERLAYEQRFSSDQPEVHDIIRGFRRVLDSYPARMMVGEVWPRDHGSLADYLRADELQQAFNFRFLFSPWKASAFRSRIEEVEALLGAEAWPTYTLSNHDFPVTSRATALRVPRLAHGWPPCCCLRCAARPSSIMARKSGCRMSGSPPIANAIRWVATDAAPRCSGTPDATAASRRRRTHGYRRATAPQSMSRSSLATHPRCCRCIGT